MTHPDNGRFTRTIANRIWQRLMGRGIVHPVDVMANEPWSEDLLDYLAVYLVDHGYDLKKLIEHIVTSRAYQSRAGVGRRGRRRPTTTSSAARRSSGMTAEQFLDAVWMITRHRPGQGRAPVARRSPRRRRRSAA